MGRQRNNAMCSCHNILMMTTLMHHGINGLHFIVKTIELHIKIIKLLTQRHLHGNEQCIRTTNCIKLQTNS